MRLKAGLSVTVVCSVAVAIYFMGWLTYDMAEVWQYLTPQQYQNVLFLWMAGTCIVGFWLTGRSLKENSTTTTVEETSSKHRANSPKTKNPTVNPDIAEMKAQLKEMAEKLADLHAVGQITKKRQETKPDA